MNKKYEMTDQTVETTSGKILNRIRALVDIGKYFKAGDTGQHMLERTAKLNGGRNTASIYMLL